MSVIINGSAGVTTNSGVVFNNVPAFSAFQSTQQTGIASSTFTKVLFQTEDYDTNSNFTSSRFTPTVAGYYQINAAVYVVNNCQLGVSIYKNNSEFKRGNYPSGTTQLAGVVSSLVYLDGVSDYVEIFVFSGGSTNSCSASSALTYFNGFLARTA
jgi:hypothetical protein